MCDIMYVNNGENSMNKSKMQNPKTKYGVTLSNRSWRILEMLSYGNSSVSPRIDGNENYMLNKNNRAIWERTLSNTSYKDILRMPDIGRIGLHRLLQELKDIGIILIDAPEACCRTQNIVICLDDFGRYCQATRKRFNESRDAYIYSENIAPSRHVLIVKVPYVELDENLYPIKVLT